VKQASQNFGACGRAWCRRAVEPSIEMKARLSAPMMRAILSTSWRAASSFSRSGVSMP
jgi:hypothetical protein